MPWIVLRVHLNRVLVQVRVTALAIISVLKAAGEEKLGESTAAKSFLDGFEKGKKQSALMVIAPLFSLFDITDEEKIIKASSFLGCSTEEIEKALAEAGQ